MTQQAPSSSETTDQNLRKFSRGLGLFDSTMLVVGAMLGSGIFIVSAEMARHVGSAGWLLVAWAVAGVLTIAGALCYGELSAMIPQAGGSRVCGPPSFPACMTQPLNRGETSTATCSNTSSPPS